MGVVEFVVTVHVCETITGQEAANLKKTFWVSPCLCKKYGVTSTVYVSPGCTPYSITLVLLTVIGDWSELTLCVIRYWTSG